MNVAAGALSLLRFTVPIPFQDIDFSRRCLDPWCMRNNGDEKRKPRDGLIQQADVLGFVGDADIGYI